MIITRQIVYMFALMSVGFILSKFKLINAEGTKTLTNILLYCSTPIVVISSYMVRFNFRKSNQASLIFFRRSKITCGCGHSLKYGVDTSFYVCGTSLK